MFAKLKTQNKLTCEYENFKEFLQKLLNDLQKNRTL